MSKRICTALVLCLCWSSANAMADHHEPGQVKKAIEDFYKGLSSGEFEKAFAHFSLGSRGYLPDGELREIPNEEARKTAIGMYQEGYKQGGRLSLHPKNIKTTIHGQVAISTFNVEGTIQAPGADNPSEQKTRASMVWSNSDKGWKLVHWHVSKAVDGPDVAE